MSRPIRVAGLVAFVALVAACGDDDTGDAERFCGEVQANTSAIVAPKLQTPADVDALLVLYRELGDLAPLSIEADWDALTLNYETASTVDPDNPESVQRVAARAYATERSAVAVHDWLVTHCAVDLGPVATIVPVELAAPRPATSTTTPGG